MNMEYPLLFRVTKGETVGTVETHSFREYGVYTLVVRSLNETVLLALGVESRCTWKWRILVTTTMCRCSS